MTQRVNRADATIGAVVMDDGSRDGTQEAICVEFPSVRLLRGNGELFWAAGMAHAEREARTLAPDYLLWLNDDVVLEPDALERLFETKKSWGSDAIVVGALRDPDSGEVAYSGLRRTRRHPLAFERVGTESVTEDADTFNGNVVLMSVSIAERLGGIDGGFSHAFADLDYGLRAKRYGINVLVSPPIGFCRKNTSGEIWRNPNFSRRARWAAILGPKGLPPRSLARFLVRHGGPVWPIYWVAPYLRLAISTAFAVSLGSGELANNTTWVPGGDDVGRNIVGNDASSSHDAAGSDRNAA